MIFPIGVYNFENNFETNSLCHFIFNVEKKVVTSFQPLSLPFFVAFSYFVGSLLRYITLCRPKFMLLYNIEIYKFIKISNYSRN